MLWCGRVRNAFDPENLYTTDDLYTDCESQATCGVFFDNAALPDRCCSIKRSDSSKVDWMDGGYVGETNGMKPDQKERFILARYIRWAWVLQFVFWGALGTMMFINPETSVFKLVMADANMEALNVDGFRQFQIESDHIKKHQDFSMSNLISHLDIGSIFSKIASSGDVTEDEKELFVKRLDVMTQELTMRAARSAIATPTRQLGMTCIFFAVYSLIQRSQQPVALTPFIGGLSFLWSICNIIGLSTAAAGTSGNFVLFMIMADVSFSLFWFYVYNKIMHLELTSKAVAHAVAAIPRTVGSDDDGDSD